MSDIPDILRIQAPARILLIGNHTEAETVLACLVGAGVGQIDLCKTAILA